MASTDDFDTRAREWLLSNGYTQFGDGTWSYQGYEADVLSVLADYMRYVEHD